jgi:type III pantothenate kinase
MMGGKNKDGGKRKMKNEKRKTELNWCIDIGNTRFKSGIFSRDEMIEFTSGTPKELPGRVRSVLKEHDPAGLIVCTTRKKIPSAIRKLGKGMKSYIELSHETPLPIVVDYRTPETLGRDRMAAAVGANSLFPQEGNIVIDAGTCITYDFIDRNGHFLGGNIAPGIRMRLRAMHDYTANLPLADPEIPEDILGKTTLQALQNGAIRGTIYEIETFISQIRAKYGDLRVILTGGDANYFADYFNSKIFVVQNLVLIGLNKILQHNA